MNKVRISLIHCNVGDILSDDVMNNKGIMLVSKNTLMNDFIITKLAEAGIKKVYIYLNRENSHIMCEDAAYEKVKYSYKSTILCLKSIINRLSTGKQIDCEKLLDVSALILDMGSKCEYIIRCMKDVRTADEYTYAHCVNVAFYGMLIAKWLGLKDSEIKNVIQAGLLHDIGKTRIPMNILNKKEQLSKEEFRQIKMHTLYGYNIIKDLRDINQCVKKPVVMHHERMDGTGYPFGIKGDVIDLYTRIISIADTYDAMTSDRVYKKRKSPFEAFEMFMSTGISMYDISVVRTFLSNLPQFFVNANVLLKNGDMGEIVYIPPHDIVSPVLNVRSRYIDLSREKDVKVLSMV